MTVVWPAPVRVAAGGVEAYLTARESAAECSLEVLAADRPAATASFIKEMIRRTVLVSLRAGDRPPVLRDAPFAAVLSEMTGERHALTRSLPGAGPGGQEPASRPAPVRYRRLG